MKTGMVWISTDTGQPPGQCSAFRVYNALQLAVKFQAHTTWYDISTQWADEVIANLGTIFSGRMTKPVAIHELSYIAMSLYVPSFYRTLISRELPGKDISITRGHY
jgi:hypothetical protein